MIFSIFHVFLSFFFPDFNKSCSDENVSSRRRRSSSMLLFDKSFWMNKYTCEEFLYTYY